MSVDYNTYVGPFLRIRGDASAFFNETHVDVLRAIYAENCPGLGTNEILAITNKSAGLGSYAGADAPGVTVLGPFTDVHYISEFERAHGAHMDAIHALGCTVILEWGVISWAS